jgi:hypothetical protein
MGKREERKDQSVVGREEKGKERGGREEGWRKETNGLSENSVTVTGNDLSTVESLPDVLLNLLVRGILADLVLHLLDPVEDLLVGKTEQRERKGRRRSAFRSFLE